MPYRYVGRCNGSLNDLDERYERISHLTVKPMRYYLLCMLKVVSIAVDRFLHPSSRDPPETELLVTWDVGQLTSGVSSSSNMQRVSCARTLAGS
jgi:hypothetical protein